MRVVFLAVLLAALALPCAAHGATVSVVVSGTAPSRQVTVTLGGATRVTVSRNGNDVFVAGRAGDTLSTTGCTSTGDGVTCGLESTVARIVVSGSSGNDELSVSGTITRPVTLDGNGGADELTGGSGADLLDGDTGDDVVRGGSGDDDLSGGTGNDVLVGDLGNDTVDGDAGADTMSGGGQTGDALDYRSRSARVTIDFTGGVSGEANENDVAEGFAIGRAGAGPDTLLGSDAAERLEGGNGADVISGGAGADTLLGGSGADALSGGAAADTLNGGDGEDLLDARDGTVDTALTCGTARDRLASDLSDPATTDCEVLASTVVGDIAVTGNAVSGATLQASFSGTVVGTDSVRAWRWARCADGSCVAVGEGQTYTATDADIGHTLKATLRAENEAGGSERDSPPVGPIRSLASAPPAAGPPPAPATPAAAAARVRSVRCSGRRCTVALTVTGVPASVKAVLTRGGKTVASATRKSPGATFTLNVTAKRALATGTYKLKVTATGADKRTKSVTRTVRVRR